MKGEQRLLCWMMEWLLHLSNQKYQNGGKWNVWLENNTQTNGPTCNFLFTQCVITLRQEYIMSRGSLDKSSVLKSVLYNMYCIITLKHQRYFKLSNKIFFWKSISYLSPCYCPAWKDTQFPIVVFGLYKITWVSLTYNFPYHGSLNCIR